VLRDTLHTSLHQEKKFGHVVVVKIEGLRNLRKSRLAIFVVFARNSRILKLP